MVVVVVIVVVVMRGDGGGDGGVVMCERCWLRKGKERPENHFLSASIFSKCCGCELSNLSVFFPPCF